MKKFILTTTKIFDDMVEELGLDAISDLDITEELRKHDETREEFGRIESWDYEDGKLEIFLED